MTLKQVNDAIIGALCLAIGWGTSTLLHELCHLMTARSLGIAATPGRCTLSTGSVIIYAPMTPLETAIVAIAGSLGLVLAGILLTGHHHMYVRMIGIVFLARAWIDVLPICGWDGGRIAGSVGYGTAVAIVIIEILICGGMIINTMQRGTGRAGG